MSVSWQLSEPKAAENINVELLGVPRWVGACVQRCASGNWINRSTGSSTMCASGDCGTSWSPPREWARPWYVVIGKREGEWDSLSRDTRVSSEGGKGRGEKRKRETTRGSSPNVAPFPSAKLQSEEDKNTQINMERKTNEELWIWVSWQLSEPKAAENISVELLGVPGKKKGCAPHKTRNWRTDKSTAFFPLYFNTTSHIEGVATY